MAKIGQKMNKSLVQLSLTSFTSLMTHLRQDINRGFSFIAGALMEHFLEWIATFYPNE